MSSLNKAYLMGNLTKDPETKQFQSGSTLTNRRLAVSESYTDKSGQKKETVCYVDVVVWGRQAETCKQYLHKGSAVLLEGRLQFDEWEKDGQKRSMLKVKADNVQFLSGGKGGRDDGRISDVSRESDGSRGIEVVRSGADSGDDEPPF